MGVSESISVRRGYGVNSIGGELEESNSQALQKITIYVTRNQYEYLKSLKYNKISMSQFIRSLIELYRNLNVKIEEEHEIIFKIRRRRKKWFKPSKLHKELLKELKERFRRQVK